MKSECRSAGGVPQPLRRLGATIGIVLMLAAPVWAQGYDKEVETLSAAMAGQIAQAGKKSVAVVDFTDLGGNVTELGRFLAEEFSAALAGAGKGFEVIDRNNLKTIMQEQKLATTGIIDPATAKKLGQIAGVDALITGTLTPFGETVRVSIKILDTATAKVVGAARGDIPKTKAIEELLGKGIGVVTGSGVAAQPLAPSKPTPSSPLPTTQAEGIVFAAQGCRADGSELTCTVRATSQGRDREIGLCFAAGYVWVTERSECLAFDDGGVKYEVTKATIGAGSHGVYADGLLVADVPTELAVRFGDFSTTASHVTLLKLGGYIMDIKEQQWERRRLVVELRRIPVSR